MSARNPVCSVPAEETPQPDERDAALIISLRDYFAIHAPASEIVVPDTVLGCAQALGLDLKDYDDSQHYTRVVARARYAYADAMLVEREKARS